MSGLRQRRRRRSAIGSRQHFVPLVGDQHRVLPLRGKTVIRGHDGPAVGEAANAGAAGVDHRLDGENHPRLQLETGAGPAVVQDLRLFVELPPDAVTAEFPDDGKAVAFGMALYGRADVAQRRAGLDLAYAAPHRIEGHFAQTLGLDRRGSDVEHATAVAVKAFLDHGHVDIDDIAGLECLVAGNAVTDNVIHRNANRRRKRPVTRRSVVQRRRNDLLDVNLVIVRDAIELTRGDARPNVRRQKIEQLRREPPGDAHFRNLVRGLDRNRHGVRTSHGQSRSNSLMLVLARVLASTCLTITAQYSWQAPMAEGRLPATTTEPEGTRP